MKKEEYRTSITVSKETRNMLKEIKKKNDEYNNYNDIISDLLSTKEGLIKEYEIIKRPQTAMVLNYIPIDESGVQINHFELGIKYSQLRNGYVGQIFSPIKGEYDNYIHESAKIIWKDDELVVLKITEEVKQKEMNIYNYLVGIDLL